MSAKLNIRSLSFSNGGTAMMTGGESVISIEVEAIRLHFQL